MPSERLSSIEAEGAFVQIHLQVFMADIVVDAMNVLCQTPETSIVLTCASPETDICAAVLASRGYLPGLRSAQAKPSTRPIARQPGRKRSCQKRARNRNRARMGRRGAPW